MKVVLRRQVPCGRILCSDNVAALRRFFPSESVDLVVTSPPYDNLRVYGGHPWDFETLARELTRVLKLGGVCVWIVADATINGSETLTSMRQALYFKDVCGLNVHDTMVWEKTSFSATGSLAVRYAPVWEYMLVLSKGKPEVFHPIKDKLNKHAGVPHHGTIRDKRDRRFPESGIAKGKVIAKWGQRHNVWRITEEKAARGQASVFPVRLAHDHIVSWSDEGAVVLDPFSGSGTTCLAAAKAGRKWVGIEVNPEYVEASLRRLRKEGVL